MRRKPGKIKNVIFTAAAVLGMLSAIAGVVDRKDQKRREGKAKAEGKEIHKPHGVYEKYFKRPMDFFLSLSALLLLGPVMAVTALLVRVKLGSPVLFRQERPGRDEEIFSIFKFRTMTDERDECGELLPDAERLGRFGKMLRASSLDELPEILNIIKGDMSIVGPRPLLVRYLPRYNEEQHRRHEVRPGLSGYAQVHGRNAVSWEERFKMDVEYVNRITFFGDMKIIFQTVSKALIKQEGISSGTSVTMEEFMGSGNVE